MVCNRGVFGLKEQGRGFLVILLMILFLQIQINNPRKKMDKSLNIYSPTRGLLLLSF